MAQSRSLALRIFQFALDEGAVESLALPIALTGVAVGLLRQYLPQTLAGELRLLAQRARLDLSPPAAGLSHGARGLEETLGLTSREVEVLTLLARGYTNREIAATLVISAKTASVHVSHILRKLGAPNRLEAAAIAHRLSPPRV